MHSYDEHTFRSQVDSALKAIRRILDVNRHPTYPAGVFHKYDDKYMLADFLTNAALAAQMNCLELLGVSPEFMKTVLGWAQERSVTLRVRSEQTCTFVKSKDRYVRLCFMSSLKFVLRMLVSSFPRPFNTAVSISSSLALSLLLLLHFPAFSLFISIFSTTLTLPLQLPPQLLDSPVWPSKAAVPCSMQNILLAC